MRKRSDHAWKADGRPMTVEIQGFFIISLIGEKVPQNW